MSSLSHDFSLQLPQLPDVLKPIQQYLKVATEHEKRDPVVSYWCRLYALEVGMKIDQSEECLKVLLPLMDWLEATKSANSSNDEITNEVVGASHVENHAMKLFAWADRNDRNAVFNKNVVKAFYTAYTLFSVCETFGELSDEVATHLKYSKWKAAYLHRCLQSKIEPVAGPDALPTDERTDVGLSETEDAGSHFVDDVTQVESTMSSTQATHISGHSSPLTSSSSASRRPDGAVDFDSLSSALNHAKMAVSALNFEDTPTAIENLQKALDVLTASQ